jgi:hypothetical protein
MGSDFANFDAGCHEPVPLETRFDPRMPLLMRGAQPVHHIVRDHEISLRALSRRNPPHRGASVVWGAGERTTLGL